jgi:hypothetical protein
VSYTSNIKYSKHNRVLFNSLEERDKGRKMFTEFFSSIRKEELGKDMDKFYSPQNKALASLLERAKPLFEKMPERTDYAVSELSL